MSARKNRPAPTLEESLRLGAGFGTGDREHVLEALAPLNRHLAHWNPEQVDLEISVKNREGPQQKVMLEAWLAGWPAVLATSKDRDLDRAVIEVRKEMIRRIEDEKAKRDLHQTRAGRQGLD
ncbi:MAG TPA: hypothetical protein VG253_09205 [Streptosporangiaceae bacterium]|jgi:ribosome-associated translation inhibitor RaiA|nr:hypothetical protein [Streptosporangiaceae bacterium]